MADTYQHLAEMIGADIRAKNPDGFWRLNDMIVAVLDWLDRNRESAPKSAVTTSEVKAAYDETFGSRYGLEYTVAAFIAELGIPIDDGRVTVVSEAQKATDDLEAWGIARGKALELGPWLAGQGWVKNSEAGDEH